MNRFLDLNAIGFVILLPSTCVNQHCVILFFRIFVRIQICHSHEKTNECITGFLWVTDLVDELETVWNVLFLEWKLLQGKKDTLSRILRMSGEFNPRFCLVLKGVIQVKPCGCRCHADVVPALPNELANQFVDFRFHPLIDLGIRRGIISLIVNHDNIAIAFNPLD